MKTNTHPRITLPTVTPNEFNALLAGLRALQYLLDTDTLPPDIRGIHTDGGRGLGIADIDRLCHRLNCA